MFKLIAEAIREKVSSGRGPDGIPRDLAVDSEGHLLSRQGQRVSVGPAQFALSITSAAAVSLTVPDGATEGEIYVRTAPVVFTRNLTTPTATKGIQANATDIIVLRSRNELINFRGIAVSTTATVDVEYFASERG